jgi:surfactin synthase thioesterase subunit
MLCPELPGRGSRILEPPFTDFHALIQSLRRELEPFLDRPTAFFGHSMGGLIAFELAHELRRRGLPAPLRVFVSACSAPQLRNKDAPIHRLPDSQFLMELRRRYGAMAGLLEHPDLLEVFVPLLRADFSVCESYVYQPHPPLDCPISAFGGSADTRPNASEVAAWHTHTRNRFTLQIFPGDHFFLHRAGCSLVRVMNQQLRQVRGRYPVVIQPLRRQRLPDTNEPASPEKGRPAYPHPVFILAMPRSFSSVVCAMLGQHPQMYGLPETNLFAACTVRGWLVQCSRPGLSTMRHGLLRAVAQLYYGEQTESSVKLAIAWLRNRANLTTGSLFQILAEKVAPRVLLEKSPHVVWYLEKMRRACGTFPHARFIHLVRHPRSQCESTLRFYQMRRAQGPIPASHWLYLLMTEPSAPGEQREDILLDPQRGWHALNERICEFLRSVPETQQLRIRGEDLLSHPDESLRQIASWLGLRTDAAAIEAMKHPERSSFARLGPPGARFGNDPLFLKQPILRPARATPQTLDGALSWRSDGSGFLPRVRELAEQFGYE